MAWAWGLNTPCTGLMPPHTAETQPTPSSYTQEGFDACLLTRKPPAFNDLPRIQPHFPFQRTEKCGRGGGERGSISSRLRENLHPGGGSERRGFTLGGRRERPIWQSGAKPGPVCFAPGGMARAGGSVGLRWCLRARSASRVEYCRCDPRHLPLALLSFPDPDLASLAPVFSSRKRAGCLADPWPGFCRRGKSLAASSYSRSTSSVSAAT